MPSQRKTEPAISRKSSVASGAFSGGTTIHDRIPSATSRMVPVFGALMRVSVQRVVRSWDSPKGHVIPSGIKRDSGTPYATQRADSPRTGRSGWHGELRMLSPNPRFQALAVVALTPGSEPLQRRRAFRALVGQFPYAVGNRRLRGRTT